VPVTPTPIPTTLKTTTHTRPTTTNTFSATPLHVKTHAPTVAHAQPTVHYKRKLTNMEINLSILSFCTLVFSYHSMKINPVATVSREKFIFIPLDENISCFYRKKTNF
jgi:hypothetical protein